MPTNSRGQHIQSERINKAEPRHRETPRRPVASQLWLLEQVIRDTATGLQVRLEKRPDGKTSLHISGDKSVGARTFVFSANGLFESIETPPPSLPSQPWQREVC